MKSPFTGGETVLKTESRTLEYRKEPFSLAYVYYVCKDTGETFTTNELDQLTLTQVHNKYRSKYSIPFADEIKAIREKYGLSAIKMSEVLGLGANIYRNYESGEMPSVANGRLIRMAEDPHEFAKLVSLSRNSFEPHEFERVQKKLQCVPDKENIFEEQLERFVVSASYPSLLNGYKTASLEKIGMLVRYFAAQLTPFTTSLNKLLFYSDFSHYRHHGYGISGITYKAIQWGPVPANYGSLYNQLVNKDYVKIQEKDFGESFYWDTDDLIELQHFFNDIELDTINNIVSKFKGKSVKQIVDISHKESGWKNNIDSKDFISYEYGFELKYPI